MKDFFILQEVIIYNKTHVWGGIHYSALAHLTWFIDVEVLHEDFLNLNPEDQLYSKVSVDYGFTFEVSCMWMISVETRHSIAIRFLISFLHALR